MSITRKNGPLYLQIKKIVKDRILHGIYPLGTIIPSEPQLEKEFGVSKVTVRNAVQELCQEGYLEKRSGVGTTVLRNRSLSRLSKGKRFTEILVDEGHRIEKKLLGSEMVTNDVQSKSFQLFGERCLRMERLYLLDSHPYIHYVHYLAPAAVAVTGDEDANMQSLYDLIEENDISLDRFRDAFTVGTASAATARLLYIPEGSPTLKRIRYSYSVDGHIVEYSIGHYNTELQPYLVSYDAPV
ncbi:GntR family transcriptional regulator [Paenibacillus medicaginis]|uniref:GntR family transcriptional regulator n=1 Tax=Paenibacillus medicaginis TaxID=1470560 RepID=A0ABV5C225_9BACL